MYGIQGYSKFFRTRSSLAKITNSPTEVGSFQNLCGTSTYSVPGTGDAVTSQILLETIYIDHTTSLYLRIWHDTNSGHGVLFNSYFNSIKTEPTHYASISVQKYS